MQMLKRIVHVRIEGVVIKVAAVNIVPQSRRSLSLNDITQRLIALAGVSMVFLRTRENERHGDRDN